MGTVVVLVAMLGGGRVVARDGPTTGEGTRR